LLDSLLQEIFQRYNVKTTFIMMRKEK